MTVIGHKDVAKILDSLERALSPQRELVSFSVGRMTKTELVNALR